MSPTSPEPPTPTFGRLPEERRQRVAAQFLSARFASASARNPSAGEGKIMSPLWTASGPDKSRSGSRFLTAPPVSRISGSHTRRTRQSPYRASAARESANAPAGSPNASANFSGRWWTFTKKSRIPAERSLSIAANSAGRPPAGRRGLGSLSVSGLSREP